MPPTPNTNLASSAACDHSRTASARRSFVTPATEDELDRIRRAGCAGATGNCLAPAETTTALLHHHRGGARA